MNLNVKARRLALGLNQREFSAKLEEQTGFRLSDSSLSLIERGDNSVLSPNAYNALVKFFELNDSQFDQNNLEVKSLEDWRLEKFFSQTSLSERTAVLGERVSQGTISQIEHGYLPRISTDTMRSLAKALGIKIYQIAEFQTYIKSA